MSDEQLQEMEPVELEQFLEECADKAKEIGVSFDYYMSEFAWKKLNVNKQGWFLPLLR